MVTRGEPKTSWTVNLSWETIYPRSTLAKENLECLTFVYISFIPAWLGFNTTHTASPIEHNFNKTTQHNTINNDMYNNT